MSATYDFWQSKKTGRVIAVKLVQGRPWRFCGPLVAHEFQSSDGRLLRFRLPFFHYGFSFQDDPYNYLLCD